LFGLRVQKASVHGFEVPIGWDRWSDHQRCRPPARSHAAANLHLAGGTEEESAFLAITACAFVPVDIAAPQVAPVGGDALGSVAGIIELRLNCGRSLRFNGGIEAALLTRLIRAVETA
jgi:hypothetical protein